MPQQPLVTVVMAVHNNVDFIDEAVTSVLQQSWQNLELLIVLDAPTDGTDQAIAKFNDRRLRIIRNEHNLGQTVSLKLGFQEAKGAYIARLDGDDIALPERIERQVNFLERHPGIGLLGSACYVVDTGGQCTRIVRWPEADLHIRWVSLLANPFWHSTVMLRHSLLRGSGLTYNDAFESAQDYDLWTRIMTLTNVANLHQPLVLYRIHGDSVTTMKRQMQLSNHNAISLRTIKQQLPEFVVSPALVNGMRELFVGGNGEAGSYPATRRIDLANMYLDMLESYIEKHRDNPSVPKLKRDEAARVVRIWWTARFAHGWPTLAKRLFALSPSLPWTVLKVISSRISGWITRYRVLRAYRRRIVQPLVKAE